MGGAGEASAGRPPQKGLVRRLGGPVNAVRFSAVVARRICARLESGETLTGMCRDADMPHRSTVRAWAKALPKFAAAMERARRAAGWHGRGGHPPKWCEWTAIEVCARVAEGQRMRDICADPEMPSMSLVYKWRRERPAFAAAIREARAMVAEQMCEDSWEVAQAVTPATAFATHVKLLHMRWMTGVFDPSRFGRFKAVAHESVAAEEADEARVVEHQWSAKVFRVEKQPDGTKRVVSYYRNHTTGELRREKLGETDEPVSAGPGTWLVQEVKRGLGLTDADTGGPPEPGWAQKLAEGDGDG